MGLDMTEGRQAHAGHADADRPDGKSVVPPGVWVDDSDEDDPVLRNADGSQVDTWREEYPYPERMTREEYDHLKRVLQVELLKLQYWVEDSGSRIVVVFEGRDAAGKGSTIKRFMEHLNPRTARVVALTIPTPRERGQWYFQRYIEHLPTAGEIVFFDRSWYNRAGVEKVMGFCTDEQHEAFLQQVPEYERLLVQEGISLTKFWFSVTPHAPWTVIKSNDKKRARLAAMRSLLSGIDYDRKDPEIVGQPDPLIVGAPADMRELDASQLSPTPFRQRIR